MVNLVYIHGEYGSVSISIDLTPVAVINRSMSGLVSGRKWYLVVVPVSVSSILFPRMNF